ncbi:MAG: N-acetyltransferase [Planctomycetes bacterium]|nr:N-acetyltransferase [Planctomycetota bacterium]
MQIENLIVRSERIGDEDGITEATFKAFGEAAEANIVEVMRRNYHAFSRKYSVVACVNEKIVGHILFSPCRIRLRGKFVQALEAAPVSVVPDYQKMGIGREMLKFGHALGAADGFALCYLLGHPEYYPRVGYKRCYGLSKGTVDTEKLPEPEISLVPCPVKPADIPWLVSRFEEEFKEIDFSWHWGTNLAEWTMDGYDAIIWRTKEGKRVAYSVAQTETKQFKLMLAEDGYYLRQMIYTLIPLVLLHHRAGWLGKQLKDEPWLTFRTWFSTAAMAIDLGGGVLDDFIEKIDFENDEPGFSAWPLAIIE